MALSFNLHLHIIETPAVFMEKIITCNKVEPKLTLFTIAFPVYTAFGAGGKTPPREPVKDLISDDCVSDIVEDDNLKPCICHRSVCSSVDFGDDAGETNSSTHEHLRIGMK